MAIENRNSCGAQTSDQITTTSNIKDAPGALLWIFARNDASGSAYFILNDATSSTGSAKMTIEIGSKNSKMVNFDPPIDFATGIRIGTIETGLTIVGCFV